MHLLLAKRTRLILPLNPCIYQAPRSWTVLYSAAEGGNWSPVSGVVDCISFDWSTIRVLSQAHFLHCSRTRCHCHSRRDTYAKGCLVSSPRDTMLDMRRKAQGAENLRHCSRNIGSIPGTIDGKRYFCCNSGGILCFVSIPFRSTGMYSYSDSRYISDCSSNIVVFRSKNNRHELVF